MSKVYLALDTSMRTKIWAIKQVDKRSTKPNINVYISKLREEINLMSSLNHNAIPRITDLIEDESTINIVMDYIEGEDLGVKLKIQGRQDEEDVIDWMKQLCDVMGYLHRHNVVHRDIKPSNLVLQPGAHNNIKLLDFGVAQKITPENSISRTIEGTPGYMPPEQMTTGVPFDPRSDIYAIGMTMHHLLTGKVPKRGKRPAKLRSVVGIQSEYTEGLEHIIEKCTQEDPNKRYQNCDELMYDLNHVYELTAAYRKKLSKKITTFCISLALVVVFAITSVGMAFAKTAAEKNDVVSAAVDVQTKSNEVNTTNVIDKCDEIHERYTNASKNMHSGVLAANYSLSMLDILSNKDLIGSIDNNNDLVRIFDEFGKECEKISDELDKYNPDELKALLCVCEANAYYLLFNEDVPTSSGYALKILKNTKEHMGSGVDVNEKYLDECYTDGSFHEQLGSAQNFDVSTTWKTDMVDVMLEFANAQQLDAGQGVNREKYLDILNTYKKVVDAVVESNLSDSSKMYVYGSAVSYLDKNYRDMKTSGVTKEELVGTGSLLERLIELVPEQAKSTKNTITLHYDKKQYGADQ